MTDKQRPGGPVKGSGPSLESEIDGLIRNNNIITVDMIADAGQVSFNTL